MLSSILAAGALIGALLTARGWPGLRWVVGSGLGVACLDMINSQIPDPVVFSAVLLFVGMCTMMMMASANSIVQTSAADDIRGRVMSVYFLVYLTSAAIGGPLLGWINQHVGPRSALFIIGVVPGTVIGLVGIRLALLSRRTSVAAAAADPVSLAEAADLPTTGASEVVDRSGGLLEQP
jgi:MFS family permease